MINKELLDEAATFLKVTPEELEKGYDEAGKK